MSSLLCLLLLASCSRTATNGPHATVFLRDGTSVSGTVLSGSATELKIAGDDKVTRTIPMAQVQSVNYDAATAAAPAATGSTTPATAPATVPQAAAPAGAPPAAPPPAAQTAPPEAAPDGHYHPDQSAITTTSYEVPAGARVEVRTEETIDSARAVEGQTFAAEVARDVRDRSGNVVIPRGANAQIIIRSASKGGRFKGSADLVMDLASVSVNGQRYRIETVDLAQRGREGVGANKRTGEFAGGGAAVGAIIGAIAGHGKGAAIGAGSGAGAGVLAEVLTKGSSIKVPPESLLTFQLEKPLVVRAAQ